MLILLPFNIEALIPSENVALIKDLILHIGVVYWSQIILLFLYSLLIIQNELTH